MAKRCKACRKAPALRLKDVCGICEVLFSGEFPGGHCPAGWPMVSRAAAVGTNPKELAAVRAIDAKAGCPTDYDARGRPILRDRAHRKAYLRAHGMHDNDGGYGD